MTDQQPTNDRIVALLEAISRQLDELRKGQERFAADLRKVATASQT